MGRDGEGDGGRRVEVGRRWVVGGSSTYHDVGMLKDLCHKLAAEVKGQQKLFV